MYNVIQDSFVCYEELTVSHHFQLCLLVNVASKTFRYCKSIGVLDKWIEQTLNIEDRI